MRRRHNRHFNLDDNLEQCGGVRKDGRRCGQWGKPNDGYNYRCNHHKRFESLKCTCAQMLQDPLIKCRMHPSVHVKTREEIIEFAKKWDENK